MKITIPPNPDALPYFEADSVGGALTLRWIGKEEKDRRVPNHRDAHFDMTTGAWAIRTESGDRKGSPQSFPFGPTPWAFVTQLFLAAGEYVYPVSENHVYAMFYRIQKVFGKLPERRQKRKGAKQGQQKKKEPRSTMKKSTFWFVVKRNPTYRIKLNPARSYRIITNDNLDGLNYAIGI